MTDPVVVGFIAVIAALIGLFLLWYLAEAGKVKGPLAAFARTTRILFGLGTFLAFAGVFGVAAWRVANEAGWFPHDRSVSVYMTQNWLVGETKRCVIAGEVTAPQLYCEDDGVPHQMTVVFHGSLAHFERGEVREWECQRKAESISCNLLPPGSDSK